MTAWDAEAEKQLYAAVFRGDGSAVVEVVRTRLPLEILQLAGDGLLDAVAEGAPGATELAAQCAAALQDRAWTGDKELRDQLLAILNQGATPMLRPLAVDLDQLADLLERDPRQGGGWIDLETGDCWPELADYGENEDDEDDGRRLYVDCRGSHDSYRDMERFIETADDPAIVDRLEIAINGKGAFRRFKDVLSRWPEELQRYFQFSAERKRGRARAWLAEAGYRPVRPARA